VTFAQVDALYELAERAEIRAIAVSDPEVQRYDTLSTRLKRALVGGSEYAQQVLGRVRRIRWELHTIPIPTSSPDLDLSGTVRDLRSLIRPSSSILGSEVALLLDDAADALAELSIRDVSPLAEQLAALLTTETVILIRDQRNVSRVERWVRSRASNSRVLAGSQADLPTGSHRIVACGAFRWFSPAILMAPRAHEIVSLRHAWLTDTADVNGLLGEPFPGVTRRIRQSGDTPASLEAVDPDELVPEVDWARLGAVATPQAHDAVRANLFLLAGDARVFLEADEGPSVFVVLPDAPRDHRVRKLETRAIQPGAFLLLRTSRGGEDAIRAAADELLGQRAPILRALQAEWKGRLKSIAESRGIARVTDELANRGMRARNVRYWLSEDNIRTASAADFQVLMGYVGLGDRAGTLWVAMEQIDNAHREAGQRIRAILEEQVERADLDALRTSGVLAVNLQQRDAGALTIYRVEARAPTAVTVPHTMLRIPESVPVRDWLG
jgi:hypothetical protein